MRLNQCGGDTATLSTDPCSKCTECKSTPSGGIRQFVKVPAYPDSLGEKLPHYDYACVDNSMNVPKGNISECDTFQFTGQKTKSSCATGEDYCFAQIEVVMGGTTYTQWVPNYACDREKDKESPSFLTDEIPNKSCPPNDVPEAYQPCLAELLQDGRPWKFRFKEYNIKFEDFVEAEYMLPGQVAGEKDWPLTDLAQFMEKDEKVIEERCKTGRKCKDGTDFHLSTKEGVHFFTKIPHLLNDEKSGCSSKDGNFYNDYGIFQFLVLTNDPQVKLEMYKDMLSGSYFEFELEPEISLDQKAKWFEEAAKTYDVNGLYMVATALAEAPNNTRSGNTTTCPGTSTEVTVYNFFGWGHTTDCPECGVNKACELGWTTPEKSITGFANQISTKYIKNGQNIIYLLRWNIATYPNFRNQYAVAISDAWLKAVKLSETNIERLRQMKLEFEIPVFL